MHELLWEIYDRTGLFDYIQAGASGEQQKANLLMLLQKARIMRAPATGPL